MRWLRISSIFVDEIRRLISNGVCTRSRAYQAAAILAVISVLFSIPPPGSACGPWFPRQYLEQGGMSLLEPPSFFAEAELNLLARDFLTPFHAVHDEFPARRARERDLDDFDTAIAAGTIQPPDPEAARLAHRRMREAIRQYAELNDAERAELPADVLDEARKNVFPSEFADYQKGLLAYSMGDHAGAYVAWLQLLARPEGERQYCSVRAAFMIGLLGCVENWDDAPHWFDLTRDLAARGYQDDGGLAAASYLREREWHREHGDRHAAAECAMRAIASGYPAADCIRPESDSAAELAEFATDPLLRGIYTSLLLADQSETYDASDPRREHVEAWLHALETAGVHEFAGAERVGWICYRSGDYSGARRWLARAPSHAPRALWLAGKLAARDGRRGEALRAYSEATQVLAGEPEPPLQTRIAFENNASAERMAAEHAIAAMGAPEFRTALDAFLRGGHWVDAAFVAERLLSVEELRAAVRQRPWAEEWAGDQPESYWIEDLGTPTELTNRLRWLFARRLVRTGRYQEASSFFPQKWRPALAHYAESLATGNDVTQPAAARSLAFWEAALEARYHGMEILGTEAAPDWFAYEGDFEGDDPAEYRLRERGVEKDRYAQSPKILPLPAILKASRKERARLDASAIAPDTRFHYRYRAATLAWEAARLLPDNDPRLAAMLNLAGRWLAGRDPEAADRFYQELETRCAGTELGRQATARRWFVDVIDPAVRNRPDSVPAPAS